MYLRARFVMRRGLRVAGLDSSDEGSIAAAAGGELRGRRARVRYEHLWAAAVGIQERCEL